MLQVKKQLSRIARGFDEGFPLLYSKFVREEIYGQTNADSPTAGLVTPGNTVGSNNHRRQLLNF
jgi:hypothetical protein